jgi:hypothetical protein
VSSCPDLAYNCIAYAAGDTAKWWWPPPFMRPFQYWPTGTRGATVPNFQNAFEGLGYEVCTNAVPQQGVEKVAIYTSGGVVQHAARQKQDGTWLSKLGEACDITHRDVAGVEGVEYGAVALVMKRSFGP